MGGRFAHLLHKLVPRITFDIPYSLINNMFTFTFNISQSVVRIIYSILFAQRLTFRPPRQPALFSAFSKASSHTKHSSSNENEIRPQVGAAVAKKPAAAINMRARTRAPRVSAREIAATFAQLEPEGLSRNIMVSHDPSHPSVPRLIVLLFSPSATPMPNWIVTSTQGSTMRFSGGPGTASSESPPWRSLPCSTSRTVSPEELK